MVVLTLSKSASPTTKAEGNMYASRASHAQASCLPNIFAVVDVVNDTILQRYRYLVMTKEIGRYER